MAQMTEAERVVQEVKEKSVCVEGGVLALIDSVF